MRLLPSSGPDRDNPSTTLRIDTRSAPAQPPADATPERRAQLERELDRVHGALLAERGSFIQLLSALLLLQGLVLVAFAVLTSSPAGAGTTGRLLLAGIGGFGGVVTLLVWLLLRPSREAMGGLRNLRRDIEARLYKDFQRRPTFAPRSLLTRGLAGLAASALAPLCVAGWVALSVYALALPPAGAAAVEANAAQSSAPRARPRAALPARGAVEAGVAAAGAGAVATTAAPAAASAPAEDIYR